MGLLRSKVGGVVFAAILIGTVGGVVAAHSAAPQGSVALTTANDSSTATAGSSSPTAGGRPTASASVTPTVTQVAPTARPTRVPPTPTPIPVPGQVLTVRGAVTSVSPSILTFVVHVFNGGGTYTCTVTSSTQWSGAASSINTLQVGMQVDASGIYKGGGGVTASSVDAQIDH
jgi:hypothetical protein